MFYSLGKKTQKKIQRGVATTPTPPPPPPPQVRPSVKKKLFVSLRPDEEICLIYAH